MVRRALKTLILGGVMVAYGQTQAPASGTAGPAAGGGEEAVRERVEKFYGLQKEGKFRQSETHVCDDSKDAYYNARKRQWLSVEISSLRYDESRGMYMVTTALGMNQATPAGIVQVKYPNTTLWRLDEGNWCMHIPPPAQGGISTPFGAMQSSNSAGGEGKKLDIKPVSEATVRSGVKADKEQLTLSTTGTSSDELTITNNLPGRVELEIIPLYVAGLKLTLTKTDLRARETATLKVEFTPSGNPPPRSMATSVLVHPINVKIPVKVVFQTPAAASK